jgi:hypothetical protein
MALVHRLAGSPNDYFDDDVTYMLAFTTLHEIGHALLDLMNVHVDPRDEEDRADEFAFLVLTNYKDTNLGRQVMHAPASFFLHLDDVEDHTNDDTDEHGRSVHRTTNAICILWGRRARDLEQLVAPVHATRYRQHVLKSYTVEGWRSSIGSYRAE